MMINKLLVVIISVSMLINACTEPNGEPGKGIENGGALNKSNVGVAAGVVAGGLVGSAFGGGSGQTLAIIGGGLLGGFLGHEIGASLDRVDQLNYHQASQKALTTGKKVKWKNPDNNHHGTITPKEGHYDKDGNYCREYSQSITIDGKTHKAYGTACREDDGVWKIKE
jgi:surface antigen